MINEYIKKIILILLLSLLIYLIILVFPTIIIIFNKIFSIILPVLISFTIAFILNPVVNKLQIKLKSRIFAITLLLVIISLIILGILIYTIPKIKNEIELFKKTLPSLIENIKSMIDKIFSYFEKVTGKARVIENINIDEKINSFFNSIFDIGKKITNNLIYYLSVLLIVPILSVYFLIDYPKITNYIKCLLKNNKKEKFLHYLTDLSDTMSKYIKGIIIVMFILFVLFSIAFAILKIPYGIIFALFIALTNVIPYLGAYIGGLLPFLFALSDSFSKAIFTIVACVIIQSIESNVLTPMIQSKYVKINPILVVLALLIFGKLFGFFGMILSLPLLTFIKITFKHYPIKYFCTKEEDNG